ncbi:MAG: stage V sporulation protein E [bacterium]|nr:stage V sporulation protein E [bacterium]
MKIRSHSLINGTLLALTLALVLLGVVMVLSSSQFLLTKGTDNNVYQYMGRQLMRFSIGLACLFFFAGLDYNRWEKWARPMMILNIVLLVLVLFIGREIKGSRRWIMGFQPSDMTKLAVIFYLSSVWAERREQLGSFFKGVLFPALFVSIPLALILKQPDHGTVFFIGVVCFAIWFAAGGRLTHLLPVAAVFIAAVVIGIYTKPVLWERINAFMHPELYMDSKGYQIVQAKIGFAHGGVWGVGLGEGVQQLGFTPESHTDMIFSIMGEELGFMNCAAVVIAYMLMVLLGYWVALRCENPFGSLVAVGCSTAIGFQAALNIAVVTGSIPTTGISLPFISYGGSALIINMIMVGLLISVARETFDAPPIAPESRRGGRRRA